MIDEIVKMALESGIWAAMFCFLFLYQLKNSKEREEKYTQTMNTLADGVKSIELLKQDIDEVKKSSDVIIDDTEKIKDSCNEILLSVKEALL